MKLYIHYNQKTHRGPGKVATNLLKGLQELEIELTNKPGKADFIGCLQHPGALAPYFPKNSLMGPNIFVLPNEEPVLIEQMKNFIVPSKWIKNKYEQFPEMKDKNIFIWSAGIDTEEWKPYEPAKDLDCLLYCKNAPETKINHIEEICKKLDLKTEKILYGSYKEDELKKLCNRTKSAILITDTESQGIAYMQILSMNIPCFVLNKKIWNYKNKFGTYTFPATSVPYFDEKCGVVVNNSTQSLDLLENFMNNIDNFNPRSYILNNHSLKHSAHRYLEILKSCKPNK